MEQWVMGEGGEAARTSCHVGSSLAHRSSLHKAPLPPTATVGSQPCLPSTQSPAVASQGFSCSLPLPSQHSPLTSAAQSHWSTAQICSNPYGDSHCVITKVQLKDFNTQPATHQTDLTPVTDSDTFGFSFRPRAQLTASQVRLAPPFYWFSLFLSS